MKRFLMVVEGNADKKFFKDYFHHLFQEKAPENSIIYPKDRDGSTGGKDKLKSEETLQALRQNTNQGGVNLVIFDADEDVEARRKELLDIREKNEVEFDLFLLPNDRDAGALEDLLEKIINPANQPVMDCWATYERELEKVRIPTKTPPTLTIPAKKTKIYAYLETLLGKSRAQKELIKDPNRNYENTQHWNLDAEYFRPLREFLENNLKDDTHAQITKA